MSTHTIQAEIEQKVLVAGNFRVYRAKIEITFEYEPTSRLAMEFRKAKLIDGNGLDPEYKMLRRWAWNWLSSDAGTAYAIECAELDLRAMRHAQ